MKPSERIETVQVEVTTACNLGCTFCPHMSLYRDRTERHVGFDEFREVFDRSFPQWHVTIFSGFSETLLNHDVFKMIEYEKARGNSAILATNGLLLDSERAQQIADLDVDGVTVTLDTMVPSRYAELRGVDALPVVLRNLGSLQEAIRSKGASTEVIINYVLMRSTAGCIRDVLDLMGREGIGSLFLIKLMQGSQSPGPFHKSEGMSWDEHEAMDYEAIRAHADRLGITVHRSSRASLHDPGCSLPSSAIYLTSSWDAFVCPFHVNNVEYRLGNLKESTIEEVRSSEQFKRLGAVFEAGSHLPECRDCACLFELI